MQIRLVLVLQLTSAEEFLVAAALESHKKNKTNVLKTTEYNMLHTFFVYLNTVLCTHTVFCKYCASYYEKVVDIHEIILLYCI